MSQNQNQNQNGKWVPITPEQLRPSSNGHVAGGGSSGLCITPQKDHKSESYEDLQLEFNPLVFSSLEQYLPPHKLNLSREVKVQYMRDILLRYLPESERIRNKKYKEYRNRIMLNYQPLYKQIYSMDAEKFFAPSFLRAIKENTEASFRNIMTEPCKGIYTFEIFQPHFCQMLMFEVDNFERWVHDTKFKIMRPNIMNHYGAVLDDFGMESMLDRLMSDFISPISRVLYTEIGGTSLDSHHGFVVEYGINRDVQLGFHVDDAEVTLNVCLGSEFTDGELFFRGVRCDEHINSEILPEEEVFVYSHVPGQAILHPGRHRHGARPTTSGNRLNLIMWCRSAAFRELKKYRKDFSSWCGECKSKKKEKERLLVMATQQELMKREMQPAS